MKIIKNIFKVSLIIVIFSLFTYLKDNYKSDTTLDGPYQVVRVVDGDTVILNMKGNDVRVRMIGIDTPESVHEDESKNTEEGIIASDFTKSLLENKMVYLEYDQSSKDKYDRTLAYLYLKEEDTYLFVNDYIIRSGYAYPMTIEPNNKYADQLLKSFEYARENKMGLWHE